MAKESSFSEVIMMAFHLNFSEMAGLAVNGSHEGSYD